MLNKTTAAAIVMTTLILSFNTNALDDKIQVAIDDGILTFSEGELVQDGIDNGSIEFIDVDSPDSILVFGVIYYEDKEVNEEANLPCPLKGTHLNK